MRTSWIGYCVDQYLHNTMVSIEIALQCKQIFIFLINSNHTTENKIYESNTCAIRMLALT